MLKTTASKIVIFVIVLVVIAGIVLVYNKTKHNPYQTGNQPQQSSTGGLSPAPTLTSQNEDQVLLQTQQNIQTTMNNMDADLNNLDTYSAQANNTQGF